MTAEKICGTCKWARPQNLWWRDEGMTDDEARSKELLYYLADERKVRFPLVCELAEFDKDGDGDQRRLCITIDGSEYQGDLYVKPNFGCVQWEAK